MRYFKNLYFYNEELFDNLTKAATNLLYHIYIVVIILMIFVIIDKFAWQYQ